MEKTNVKTIIIALFIPILIYLGLSCTPQRRIVRKTVEAHLEVFEVDTLYQCNRGMKAMWCVIWKGERGVDVITRFEYTPRLKKGDYVYGFIIR